LEVNQYLEIFLEESKEHLQLLNDKLLLLEKENENLDLVNEIFRSAHTLKGMAATMGYENMAILTHEMENLLDLIRNKKRLVDSDVMDTIFHSVDLLEQMVALISQGEGDQVDANEVTQKLQQLTSGKSLNRQEQKSQEEEGKSLDSALSFDEYERTIIKQSLESGYSVYHIVVEIVEETVLKSARAYMVFHELESHGEIIKSNPSVEELEKEDFGLQFDVVLISKDSEEKIKKSVLNVSEIASVSVTSISKEQLETRRKQPEKKQEAENQQTKQKNTSTNQFQKPQLGKMIRVDIERLDELMNLFSELVIDRGRLEQLAGEIKHPQLTDTIEHMSRISSSLQNNILNLRMVPIEQVFNRFPRMIRDLSKELNKKINLTIIGEDTELDRTVIDEIGDPLVHLLRNAIDHGIESYEERRKNNKPESGDLTLKAYHSGNYVFIEISDDGKGIDRSKILQKAIEKGMIGKEEGENLSDKQVYDLLFTSGFSTAKQVSDISGRGVGLDVVKSKIESLGGFVFVESQLGVGTTFTIQLPLTLSIISAMLVKIRHEKYAIPLSSIIETAVYKKNQVMSAHKQDVIDFRGRVVPLVYLEKVFEVPSVSTEEEENDEFSVVIVRKGEKMAGLVVNSFIGQQEIVLKSLGNYLPHVFAMSGATILGDGQVALIIDTNVLIK